MEVVKRLDGARGPVLFQALRYVYEWSRGTADEAARTRLEGRPVSVAARELMDDATEEVPELAGAFETFAALRESPAEIAPARVGGACRGVAAWAEERSLITVAAHFAEAAAYADTESPECANDAGRLCRRAALNERAALWFDRAFYAARRLKRRREMIRALLGYGSLAKNMGHMDAALDAYERAARLARRTRRRKQAAEAYHDLLAITAEIGPFEHAEMHALTAAQLYPATHPYLPALAHDWAFLLVRIRHYTPALPLLRLALLRIERPGIRALVWSTLAWAAGGAQRAPQFEEAEREALALVAKYDEYAPAVYIHLAEGARRIGRWTDATAYSAAAERASAERGAAMLEVEARELLQAIKDQTEPPGELVPADPDGIELVRVTLTGRLQPRKGPETNQPGANPGGIRSRPGG
ncbi:hypothetical protein [Longimicrobium sp.]|uniref:hypothetical protein n=1 Tax=Longimicrobium sp. TaxID=2029185 RepID=UPI002E2FB3DF|nr:hypothetical protein [Longimicrobium sp.]HEX6036789.1 hypothetical protein [Longimicrobium sp.]